ncbi:MAG: aldehyde dehydrogenase [Candidatus Humimicrobiaceae bacterium]
MAIDEKTVEKIVRSVVDNLAGSQNASSLKASSIATSKDGLFDNIEDAIKAAKTAQQKLSAMGKDIRYKIVDSIKEACREHVERLARITVDETEMGNYEDKVLKVQVSIDYSVGPEDLEIETYSSDSGTQTFEMAPWGVIGAITPMTNPTPMIINNSIVMISAGNSIVFLPHPKANKCTLEAFKIVHQAIVDAGGPPNLITATREAKIKNVSNIFKSPDVDMICATGGPAIVELSMKSGKKAIGAGPGNPPVIVDDTADIAKAAEEIAFGAAFDNNVLCNDEKIIILMRSIADKFLSEIARHNTVVLNADQASKVTDLVVKDNEIVKELMGKDCTVLLKRAGADVGGQPKLAVFVADSESHPLVQHEQLLPVVPILLVDTFEEAVEIAVRVEHGFKHTAMIHSNNLERITNFGQRIGTTNYIVNGHSQRSAGKVSEGGTAWTLAGATGEGHASPRTFTRQRKITFYGSMNFVK